MLLVSIIRLQRIAQRVEDTHRARTAPGFNAVRFLQANENGISRLLADILNPDGSHGQGGAFLDSFLDEFWPDSGLKGTPARAHVERLTDRIDAGARRIDIVVEFERGGILGIENKVWEAADQEGQVRDYLQQFARMHPRHQLIYLTRAGRHAPSRTSLGDVDEADRTRRLPSPLALWSFPDLIPWLRRCIGAAQNERVRGFLDDFIGFIRTDLEGISTLNAIDLLLDAALESPAHVKVAMELVNAGRALKEALLERFKIHLRERVQRSVILPQDWVVHADENLMHPGSGVSVRCDTYGYGFRLDFYASEANDVSVGIASRMGPSLGNEGELNAWLNPILGRGRTTINWAWYAPFKPYRNWGNDADAMAAVSRGDPGGMADLVVSEWERIYTVLGEDKERVFRSHLASSA